MKLIGYFVLLVNIILNNYIYNDNITIKTETPLYLLENENILLNFSPMVVNKHVEEKDIRKIKIKILDINNYLMEKHKLEISNITGNIPPFSTYTKIINYDINSKIAEILDIELERNKDNIVDNIILNVNNNTRSMIKEIYLFNLKLDTKRYNFNK